MTATNPPITYRERVLPKAITLAPLVLVLPVTFLTFLPIDSTLGIGLGVGIVLVALVSIWFASPVIEIDDAGLSLGEIQLPKANLGPAKTIPAKAAFEERGIGLNAMAFTRFQASVKTMVKIEVIDPDDPTPYWLFSTRNPEKVVEVIETLRRG